MNQPGIVALNIYVPKRYVDQTALEQHDHVSSGKYTIGLGQDKMSFVDCREDIYSLCLTGFYINVILETKPNSCSRYVGKVQDPHYFNWEIGGGDRNCAGQVEISKECFNATFRQRLW